MTTETATGSCQVYFGDDSETLPSTLDANGTYYTKFNVHGGKGLKISRGHKGLGVSNCTTRCNEPGFDPNTAFIVGGRHSWVRI